MYVRRVYQILQNKFTFSTLSRVRNGFSKKHRILEDGIGFFRGIIDVNDNSALLEWLCTTPKLTSIRVNLLRSTTENVKSLLVEAFATHYPLSICPKIFVSEKFPEMILIGCLENEDELIPTAERSEVVVDVNCAASILRGAHLYAPGVLAMETNISSNEFVNVYADLNGICKRGTTTFDSPNKLFIGTGVAKMQRHQLFRNNIEASGIAVEMKSTLSKVPSIGDAYLPDGCAMLQNLPSIVCSRVLNPSGGERILDMCAAPGNKTTHLAELMKDEGVIIAVDKTPNRVKILQDKITSYQLKSVKCFAYDSTKLLLSVNEDGKSPLEPPFCGQFFDKILLDAPCSALGNRPQLRNDVSLKMLASYPVVQKKLLTTAFALLKSQGTLVYSTCTVTSAENEEIVEWALKKFDDIELVPAEPLVGGPGWSNAGLSDEQRWLVQRFGPERESFRSPEDIYSDTVGFFISKFKKK